MLFGREAKGELDEEAPDPQLFFFSFSVETFEATLISLYLCPFSVSSMLYLHIVIKL